MSPVTIHHNNSYYEGDGIYQELYDKVVAGFPSQPNKYNTSSSQNFVAIVAAAYKAYHEECILPYDFYAQYHTRYHLPSQVAPLLKTYLYNASTSPSDATKRSLDKLLDLAIVHAHYDKPLEALISKLTLIAACQNVLW